MISASTAPPVRDSATPTVRPRVVRSATSSAVASACPEDSGAGSSPGSGIADRSRCALEAPGLPEVLHARPDGEHEGGRHEDPVDPQNPVAEDPVERRQEERDRHRLHDGLELAAPTRRHDVSMRELDEAPDGDADFAHD